MTWVMCSYTGYNPKIDTYLFVFVQFIVRLFILFSFIFSVIYI